jgi:hypothetical protein
MRIVAPSLRPIMVDETSGTEKFEAKHRAPDLEDRERMTEKALAAIRQTGPAAALEKCCALVNQINAELLKREKIEPYAVAELQAYLTRANAVIKTVPHPKTPLHSAANARSVPTPAPYGSSWMPSFGGCPLFCARTEAARSSDT